MCNFYKTNSEILNLDPFNENDFVYIKFNHWISRKENLNRINGARGTFEITINEIQKNLEISRGKAQRLLKWFEDKGIIECLEKSSVKGKSSIYAYTSVYYEAKMLSNSDTNCDTDSDTNVDTDNVSDFNSYKSASDTNNDTNTDTELGNNKKDNIKREYKKNIYNRVIEKLNSAANTKYRASTQKTQKLINARLNEGFEVEDFEKVIDIKAKEWLGTDMEKFLRPETLFGNKFEGYLNQKEKVPTSIGTKKNNYKSSICNNAYKNTETIKVVNNFV